MHKDKPTKILYWVTWFDKEGNCIGSVDAMSENSEKLHKNI